MKSCYFCSETECLEEHHVVPRRYDGSDEDENLVKVCPTCHRKLESLYDKSFYERIGRKIGFVTRKELERKRDVAVEILKDLDCERSKGFLYGVEYAMGVRSRPWKERAESYVAVKFNNIAERCY